MPCSCSKDKKVEPFIAEAVVNPVAPATTQKFSTKGNISLGSSDDIFVDLAYTLPFAGSAADAYITSRVSKQFLLNFEPTYFQIPYVYSAADNLINGNYKKTVTVEDNKVITTYIIPYTRDLVSAEVTITTILNTLTNILFYQIPREFSYNSKEEASVAVVPDGTEYIGKLLIPSSFITIEILKPFSLDFKIKINNIIKPVSSDLLREASIAFSESCDVSSSCYFYCVQGKLSTDCCAFCTSK
jgi:hypothetical protein